MKYLKITLVIGDVYKAGVVNNICFTANNQSKNKI